jgi:hypothetical protein
MVRNPASSPLAGFLLYLGMPIRPLRPSPSFLLQPMPNGSALDSARLNQFQQAMSAFAGRGATTTEICGARVNGLIQVPLGVVSKGFANSFRLDKKSIAVPLWVSAGYDSLTMLFQVRLGALKSVPTSVAPRTSLGNRYSLTRKAMDTLK